MAGNTTKRLTATPQPDKPNKRRREDPGTAIDPGPDDVGDSGTQQVPDQDITTTRSRWDRWQSHLSSPESPEDTRTKRRRRDNPTRKPTECGLEGPSIAALRDQRVHRHPHQGREGPSVGEWSARILRNRDEEGQPAQGKKSGFSDLKDTTTLASPKMNLKSDETNTEPET